MKTTQQTNDPQVPDDYRKGLRLTFRRQHLLRLFGQLNEDTDHFIRNLSSWSYQTCSGLSRNIPVPGSQRMDGSHYDTNWMLYLIGGAEHLAESLQLPVSELRTLIATTWYTSNLEVSAHDARLIHAEVTELMAREDCDAHGLRETGIEHMAWWLENVGALDMGEPLETPEPLSFRDICIIIRDRQKHAIH